MAFRETRPHNKNEYYIFLMGLFSTFQLVEIAGITMFTFLLFVLVVYSFMLNKKVHKDKSLVTWVVICAFVSEIGLLASGQNTAWYSKSLKSFVLFLSVYFAYLFFKRDDRKKAVFLKGVYWSCLIQFCWAIGQIILYRLLKLNLNKIVFEQLLHMSGDLYHVQYDGVVKPSGLNSNVGMMVPIVLFSLTFSRHIWMKVAITLLALFSGSTTPIIAVFFYWFLFVVHLRKKNIIISVLALILSGTIVVMIIPSVASAFAEIIGRLFARAQQVLSGKYTDGSTFAHFRYYTAIPQIVKRSSLFRVFWGYGFRCAGIPYIEIFNQYPDLLWIPESDPITFLVNLGLLGAVPFYLFLVNGIRRAYKNKQTELGDLLTCFVVAGFFYGLQLNWVLLVEYLLIDSLKPSSKSGISFKLIINPTTVEDRI